MPDYLRVVPDPPQIKNIKRLTPNQVAFLYAMPQEENHGIIIKDDEWAKFAISMVKRGYGYWGNRVDNHITFFLTLAGRQRVAELKGSAHGGEYTET